MIKIITNKRGYTLLMAVIVSSVVLAIAAFILSISRKQIILSAAAKDSTVAVYAADSAVQCAVAAFGASTSGFDTGSPLVLPCNGQTSTATFDTVNDPTILAGMNFGSGDIYQSSAGSLEYVISQNSNSLVSCAILTITIGPDPSNSSRTKTIIDSRGYNMGDNALGVLTCPENNPRAIERAIRLTYSQ